MKIRIVFFILLFTFGSESIGAELCAEAKPLEAVPPKYPHVESRYVHSGYAVVKFIIDPKGGVVSPEVVKSYSEPTERVAELFGWAAIEAIKKWKFNPRDIPCEAEKKIVFELE